MAATASATAAPRCATSRPSPRTRSIQPVSALPSITSGWSSRSSTKLLFVAPPAMITVVSASARRSLPSASSRSRPYAMIFAIIESKSAGMVSPSLTPVSTRMPGPVGRSSRTMRPGDGAKSRSGSSALSRASMACPISAGGLPASFPPAATCSCALTRSIPVVSSVTGCSTCSRVFTSRKANRFSAGWYRNSTVPAP